MGVVMSLATHMVYEAKSVSAAGADEDMKLRITRSQRYWIVTIRRTDWKTSKGVWFSRTFNKSLLKAFKMAWRRTHV